MPLRLLQLVGFTLTEKFTSSVLIYSILLIGWCAREATEENTEDRVVYVSSPQVSPQASSQEPPLYSLIVVVDGLA